MLRLIVLTVLLFATNLLSGCTALAQTPPDKVIELAIARTLTTQQQTIAQALDLEAPTPNFKIEKITVKNRQKLTAPPFTQYPGQVYKVTGNFQAKLKTTERPSQPATPFGFYLSNDPEETSETQTWYLIPPDRLNHT